MKKGANMRIINSISYCPSLEFRGLGDLYLPDNVTPETRAVLTIHGGGWSAQEKALFPELQSGFAVN